MCVHVCVRAYVNMIACAQLERSACACECVWLNVCMFVCVCVHNSVCTVGEELLRVSECACMCVVILQGISGFSHRIHALTLQFRIPGQAYAHPPLII
jgi:hypothetical protein